MQYWICDAEPTKTIVVAAGDTETVEFENRWYGTGIIHKEMADGTSPIGFKFEVRDMNGEEVPGSPFEVMNEDGDVYIGLLAPGQYIVKEIIPEGSLYQPVGANPKTLVIEGGKDNTVNFWNALPSARLTAEKVDPAGGHLPGATFLLEYSADNGATWAAVTYNSNAEVVPGGCSTEGLLDGCLTTDASGIVVFDGLHPDMLYRLTEVQAPNGYMLLPSTAFEGKLPAPDYNATIVVTNHPVIDIPATGNGTSHLFAMSIFAFVIAVMLVLSFVVMYNYLPLPNRTRR
jgi:uncharacterized surface anchored protein